MTFRSMMRVAAPLGPRLASMSISSAPFARMTSPRLFAQTAQRTFLVSMQQKHAVEMQRTPVLAKAATSAAPTIAAQTFSPPGVLGGVRAMSSWRLRPYATAGTTAVSLSTLTAGHSKVSLSLLVMPWKALPIALVLAPVAWLLPAIYRFVFTNSLRGGTAAAFSTLLYLTASIVPVACFENLWNDLAFYTCTLVSTFFMYFFFPEIFLNDFMFMHYVVLFTIPIIPLAFAYMPMFAARAYLTL